MRTWPKKTANPSMAIVVGEVHGGATGGNEPAGSISATHCKFTPSSPSETIAGGGGRAKCLSCFLRKGDGGGQATGACTVEIHKACTAVRGNTLLDYLPSAGCLTW